MDLKNLIDQTKTIVLLIKDGKIVYANTYAISFFGYDNLIDLPIIGTIVPLMETTGRNLEKAIDNIEKNPERHPLHVNENVTAKGDHVWVIWSNSQYTTQNRETMLLSVGMEVTGIVKRQKSLESVFTNSLDGIAFLDPEFIIVDYNTPFMNMMGFNTEEEMKRVRTDESSSYGEYIRGFINKILDSFKTQESIRIQREFKRYDGTSFIADGVFSKIRNLKGEIIGYVANLRDNTEIYRKATTDMLTQIYNRRHFEELAGHELNNSLRYRKPLSLILCDIDHFKKVNDNYGHLCGDMVLKEIASEIKYKLRDSDIFARVGGEEFAILLPATNIGSAYHVAEKIRGTIEAKLFIYDAQEFRVTMSFGISELDTKIG